MPIDPYMQNYQVAQNNQSKVGLRDQLRQQAIQAQTEQNTQLDTNQVDLVKGLLANLPAIRDTFGGVGAGAMLPQFDPRFGAIQGSLNTPDSFTNVRDQLELDTMKAGALQKMGAGYNSFGQVGLVPDTATGEISRLETPQERIAQTNQAGALERTRLTEAGAASRAANTSAKPQMVKVTRNVPGIGPVEYSVPAESLGTQLPGIAGTGQGDPANTAQPIENQFVAPDNANEQASIQQADQILAQIGYMKAGPAVKQADGSYIQDVQNNADPSAQIERIRIFTDGVTPPTWE